MSRYRQSVVCLSSVTIVNCGQTVRDRPMVTVRQYCEVDIGLSESAKNVTLDDLEEVNSRSRNWKWPVSSKRLLLGPGCLWTKMFLIAQLIKVHLDLWPWLTFRDHVKVTNEKMAYIFLMVQDKHVVNMNHFWEFDIAPSESANKEKRSFWGHI